MNTMAVKVTSQQMMRMSDPRLPLMVSRAAMAFDNACRGEAADFGPAKDLAQFLRKAFEDDGKDREEGSSRRNLDIGTVGLIGRALNDSEWDGGAKTVSDVVNKAWQIAESMEKMPTPGDDISMAQMKAFCVALGNCLIAYRESLHD